MDLSYLVFEGYDCFVFRNKTDIINLLETWDIINDEYKVFDTQGYLLKFVVDENELRKLFAERKMGFVDATRKGVVVDLIRASEEPQVDEVKGRVREFLGLIGWDRSECDEDSLERIVEKLVGRFGEIERH